jgi:hypothetical protein
MPPVPVMVLRMIDLALVDVCRNSPAAALYQEATARRSA